MKIRGQGTAANRRSFESDLNLTSFIDIFSMLIFFLIFNMVLNEVAAIEMKMGSDQASTSPIQEPVKEVVAELKISITPNSVELWERGKVNRLQYTEEVNFDWAPVADFVKQARARYPDKKDMIVQSKDAVSYGMVVRAMDYSLSEGFKELVVMGAD